MVIVLNGPLGIGKSSLAEALTESIDACAMLSGDHLVAVNPPSKTESRAFALDNRATGCSSSALRLLELRHRASGSDGAL